MSFFAKFDSPTSRGGIVAEALLVTLGLTLAIVAASRTVPEGWVATVVGFLFLGTTWLFVWRREDAYVEARGLALGGLVLPSVPDSRRWFRAAAGALAVASLTAFVTFVPFYFAFRGWTVLTDAHLVPGPGGPVLRTMHDVRSQLELIESSYKSGFIAFRRTFVIPFTVREAFERVLGQVVLVALPEEAYYRGYLQSRLTDAFPARRKLLGAPFGAAILLTSALFALGHLATIPAAARLAVFFPSLLFGWLRVRTKGIGAGLAYHAACNIFSETLIHGYFHG